MLPSPRQGPGLLVLPTLLQVLLHSVPARVLLQHRLRLPDLLLPNVHLLPSVVHLVRHHVPAKVRLPPVPVPDVHVLALPSVVHVLRHHLPAQVLHHLRVLPLLLRRQDGRHRVHPLPLHHHNVPQVLPGMPLLHR